MTYIQSRSHSANALRGKRGPCDLRTPLITPAHAHVLGRSARRRRFKCFIAICVCFFFWRASAVTPRSQYFVSRSSSCMGGGGHICVTAVVQTSMRMTHNRSMTHKCYAGNVHRSFTPIIAPPSTYIGAWNATPAFYCLFCLPKTVKDGPQARPVLAWCCTNAFYFSSFWDGEMFDFKGRRVSNYCIAKMMELA